MISSLQQNVPGSLASCAPVCWLGCQRPMTAPSGVGEDRHAAGVHDVHRRHEHGAAVGGDLGHGVVGAVHVDVGHPDRRHVGVHLGAEAGHRLPAQVAHGVAARLGRPLRAVPAEEGPVELPRLGQVRAAQVHPRGDSVVVALDLHGAFSLSVVPRRFRRYPIDVPLARGPRVRRSRECHSAARPDEPQPDRHQGGAAGPGAGGAHRAADRRRHRHRRHPRPGRRREDHRAGGRREDHRPGGRREDHRPGRRPEDHRAGRHQRHRRRDRHRRPGGADRARLDHRPLDHRHPDRDPRRHPGPGRRAGRLHPALGQPPDRAGQEDRRLARRPPLLVEPKAATS